MKKIVYSFGAFVALVLSVSTLSSCQNKDLFDADFAMKEATQKYANAFEQKYGTVDPNQSWDFCSLYEDITPTTRGENDFSVGRITLGPGFWGFMNQKQEKQKVQYAVDTAKVKDWNPYISVELYPAFVHGNDKKNTYYHMGAIVNNELNNITEEINVKNKSWYYGGSTLNHDSGRLVETRGLTSDKSFYWVVYDTQKTNSDKDDEVYNDSVKNNMAKNELKHYKEIIVNGHVYWCFDCDRNNDYSDLICLVKNPYPLEPMCKRYMIEDLGSIGDFDFNDVVVDVEENAVITHEVTYENGIKKTDKIISQVYEPTKAVIRAMGGTIDFELTIGTTSWTKSGAGFEAGTMYNTQGTIDYDKVLAEFEVTGWSASANNVSITVNGQNGEVYTITFPKAGTAPMIIAVDPTQKWMPERESVPSSWFYIPE